MGDLRLDAPNGRLEALVEAAAWAARALATRDLSAAHAGVGRELFAAFRAGVGRAEEGASIFAR
jgi:phosphogluconate dehydratase